MDGVQSTSCIPSIFEFVLNQFPAGAEVVEFVDESGKVFSGENLKAVERQEFKMESHMSEKVKALLDGKFKKNTRIMKTLFKHGTSMFLLCSDDTLWIRSGDSWEKCPEEVLPAIPQEA